MEPTRRWAFRMASVAALVAFASGCTWLYQARLAVSPDWLEFPVGVSTRQLSVRNSGAEGSLLRWRLSADARLSANPSSGTLRAGEEEEVILGVDRSGLTETLILTASVVAGGSTVEVGVVVDPLTPSAPAPCDPDPAIRYAGIEALPVTLAAARFAAAGIRPTSVLVGWEDGVMPDAAVLGRSGVITADLLPPAVADLSTAVRPLAAGFSISSRDPVALALALERDPRVRWVELDGPVVRPHTQQPSDPFYVAGDQWWLDAFGFAAGRVPTADVGAADVVVAVIDTGLRVTHEDMFAAALPGRSFVGFGSGAQSLTTVTDTDGHGTHVSGLIAATENNGVGIVGLAAHAGVRVLPVKVFGDDNTATIADLVAALRWTAGLAPAGNWDGAPPANGRVDVVNLSLGTRWPAAALRKAVIDVRCEGIVLAGAAGNGINNVGVDGGVDYPAAYPEVLAVGSVDEDQQRSPFSDFGEGLVDLMAPGGRPIPARGACPTRMLSTGAEADDAYACLTGTSMATPLVAASAAVLIARDPETYRGDQDAIEAALRAAAARNPGPNSAEYGYGVLCLDALTTNTSVCGVPVGP